MTTDEFKVIEVDEPLYSEYDFWHQQPPACIYADADKRTIEASLNYGGAYSGAYITGDHLNICVPRLKASIINPLMHQLEPIISRVMPGLNVSPGQRLDDDTLAAIAEIESATEGFSDSDEVAYLDGEVMYGGCPPPITATMANDEVETLVAENIAAVTGGDPGDYWADHDDILSWALEFRDRLREDAENAKDEG